MEGSGRKWLQLLGIFQFQVVIGSHLGSKLQRRIRLGRALRRDGRRAGANLNGGKERTFSFGANNNTTVILQIALLRYRYRTPELLTMGCRLIKQLAVP